MHDHAGRTELPHSVKAMFRPVTVFAPEPGNGVGDPVSVARNGIEEARRTLHDVVIVDTAGRLGIDQELMKQAADIRDAVNPDEILFVVDATNTKMGDSGRVWIRRAALGK